MYGFAVDMGESGPTGGLFRDAFHKPRENGAKVDGKFVAINWQWDGKVKNFRHDGAWDFQIDVPGYAGTNMKWWNSGSLDASGAKTEHLSPDTRPGNTAFIQGSTAGYFGHYYIHDVTEALDGEADFPAELDSTYFVYQGENDVTGQIDLNGAGLYNVVEQCPGAYDATVNCDKDYSVKKTFEDIDGLEVISAAEGLYAVIQEDSGNDLGERIFITSTLEHENDGKELTYHFMAMSGGKYNTRVSELVGVPSIASGGGNAHEFSGVIDLSGMLAKKGALLMEKTHMKGNNVRKKLKNGQFLINAHDGEARRLAEHMIPINDKLIALGLQAHNLNDGVIAAFKADRGGQLLLYQPDI